MLSRVADAIYWMSRYVERAENLARFVDVTLNMMLDLPEGMREQWMPLIYTTGDHETFTERYGAPTQDNVVRFLAFDRQNPNSILSCLYAARENARSVRDTISSEMWEELNTFYYMVKDAADNRDSTESAPDFFHDVKMGSHLFKGITDNTMSHNEGWHFAQLGRLLERAD
ncbi:MAG TPA: alpha-E domain-containing protein, partial [Pirellulales bacterium]